MSWVVQPEPTDGAERSALLRALEEALGDDGAARAPEYESRWWRAGLADLGGGLAPEELRSEPGVVEP